MGSLLITTSADYAYNGDYSLKLSASKLSFFRIDIPITTEDVGKIFQFKCSARFPNITGSVVLSNVLFDSTRVNQTSVDISHSDQEQFVVLNNTPVSNTEYIRINVYLQDEGYAYLDDLTLYKR